MRYILKNNLKILVTFLLLSVVYIVALVWGVKSGPKISFINTVQADVPSDSDSGSDSGFSCTGCSTTP